MSIKSTKQAAPASSISFPKLMISDKGNVVLFKCSEVGTVVHDEDGQNPIGYFTQSWQMERFSHYASAVVLSNES